MVDADTLDTTLVELPMEGGPSYYVTREGNFVVVTNTAGTQTLLLYDVDNDQMTQLQGLAIDLNEFVSRLGHGELWLVDEGLYRLDFLAGEHERISLSWQPDHINILRQRDLLVLDDNRRERLVFFDPDSLTVTQSVPLPE
jgi:hypothetical protein